MSKFKVGDRVRSKEYYPSINGARVVPGDVGVVVGNDHGSTTYESGDLLTVEFDKGPEFENMFASRFELVKEEENKAQLKKNWSIACHNEDTFNAIISLCKVLGYPIWWGGLYDPHWICVGTCSDGDVCMTGEKERHFESLESFIRWHFKPEEPELTEEQKEILELETVIQSLQDKIEEASMRVKKLKEVKK